MNENIDQDIDIVDIVLHEICADSDLMIDQNTVTKDPQLDTGGG